MQRCAFFLLALWCLVAWDSARGATSQYVMRSAHPYFLTDEHQLITTQQTSKLKTASQGRLVVRQYSAPEEDLDAHALSLVRNGKFDAAVVSLTELAEAVPKFNILLSPYLFPSYKVANQVIDEYLLDWMREELRPLGLSVLGVFVFGFRSVTSSELSLETPEQFAGLKCAVSDVPHFEYVMQALKASPVRYADERSLVSDLRKGRLPCLEMTLAKISYHQVNRFHHHLVLTEHVLDFRPWVVSKKFYDALPSDLKQLLLDDVREECSESWAFGLTL